MLANTERREVAKLLRERAGYEMGCVFKELYGDCNSAGPTCGECNERAMHYVADLIDPTRNCSEPTRTYGECDRDAVLELADDLEAQQANKGLRQMGPYMQPGEAARRIREALGVQDA